VQSDWQRFQLSSGDVCSGILRHTSRLNFRISATKCLRSCHPFLIFLRESCLTRGFFRLLHTPGRAFKPAFFKQTRYQAFLCGIKTSFNLQILLERADNSILDFRARNGIKPGRYLPPEYPFESSKSSLSEPENTSQGQEHRWRHMVNPVSLTRKGNLSYSSL